MHNKLRNRIEQSILSTGRCQWVGALIGAIGSLGGAAMSSMGADKQAAAVEGLNLKTEKQWDREQKLDEKKFGLAVRQFGVQKNQINDEETMKLADRAASMFNTLPMKNNLIKIFSGKA